jgi:hypothetical protein
MIAGMHTAAAQHLVKQKCAEQESRPAPPQSETERQVHNYGDLDRSCVRWTDHCRRCIRADNGDIHCSNIGISCQPAGVECEERQKDSEKK